MLRDINALIDDEEVGDEELISSLHEGYQANQTSLLLYLSRNLRKAPRYIPHNSDVVRTLLKCGAAPFLLHQKMNEDEYFEFKLLPQPLRSTLNLAVLSGNLDIIERLLDAGDRINRHTLSYVGKASIFRLLLAKGAKATFEDCLLHQSTRALTRSSLMME